MGSFLAPSAFKTEPTVVSQQMRPRPLIQKKIFVTSIIWRVSENEIEGWLSLQASLDLLHLLVEHHGLILKAERFGVFPDQLGRFWILFDKHDPVRPTRKRFETKSPATGEEFEDSRLG